MTRFLLDTGIAGLYLAKARGVFERAQAETANARSTTSVQPAFVK